MRIILDTDKKTITVPWNYAALLPQAPPVNAYAFSTRQTYSKFFSLNGHSSTTTQPRHSGLRALQILRPCQINQ